MMLVVFSPSLFVWLGFSFVITQLGLFLGLFSLPVINLLLFSFKVSLHYLLDCDGDGSIKHFCFAVSAVFWVASQGHRGDSVEKGASPPGFRVLLLCHLPTPITRPRGAGGRLQRCPSRPHGPRELITLALVQCPPHCSPSSVDITLGLMLLCWWEGFRWPNSFHVPVC